MKRKNSSLRKTLFISNDQGFLNNNLKYQNKINLTETSNLIENQDYLTRLLLKLDNDMHKIQLINLKQFLFKVSFYNGFVFLSDNINYPNSNSMGVKLEANTLTLNLNTKSIKNLIKNIIQLIIIGKKDEIISKKIDEIIYDEVKPIEKVIYKEMQKNLKKFKLLVKKVRANFKSDNNLSTDFILEINKFSFLNLGNLIYTIDPLNQKLVSNSIDLRFQDICILAEENSYILNVPNYNLYITEDIYLTREKKESQIKNKIASDLGNFYIYTHTEKLNKILENVIEIVDGVDKIDCLSFSLKKIEKYKCEKELNLNFKNFDICIFNENLMLNIRNLNMLLKIDQTKFEQDNINIMFSPFIMSISNPFDTNTILNNITSRSNYHQKSRNRISNKYFDKRSSLKNNVNSNDNGSLVNFLNNNNNGYNSNINNPIFETNEFFFVSDIMLNNFKIELNETRALSTSNT